MYLFKFPIYVPFPCLVRVGKFIILTKNCSFWNKL